MSVRLEAIQFNHDPNAASVDALNIRRNATEFVNVPEWRRGISVTPQDSPAAYAMSETQGHTLTIQAQFRRLNEGVKSLQIRAVDPTLDPPGPRGCAGWLAWLLRLLVRALAGNVLGEVKARWVSFPASGLTGFETFELKNVTLWSAGVGARTTTWRWQHRHSSSGSWHDFETTEHRIYVLAASTKAPWTQAPHAASNALLPWTDVLDYACNWAVTAKTANAAAAGVTRGVYALGPGVITYDCPNGGSTHYASPSFNCTRFIERLRGGLGNGQYVNCTDCATIVSTFANALGSELWQSRMEEPPNSSASGFGLNPLLGIGSNVWQTACGWGSFNYHEVAWKGACTSAEVVFDACLQVDGDADPTSAPHSALLPVGLVFGTPGAGLYRDRLATPATRPDCEPNPGSRQRRAIV